MPESRVAVSIVQPEIGCLEPQYKPLGTYLPDPQKAEMLHEELERENRLLLESRKNYNAFTSTKKRTEFDSMKTLVRERQNVLTELARENASLAISALASPSDRAFFGQISGCVEKVDSLEGVLEVEHVDFFDQKVSVNEYRLITEDKRRILIHPAFGLRKNLLSGDRIKIKGMQIGKSDFLFDGTRTFEKPNGDFGGFSIMQRTGNPPVYGDQKALVLMVNFQNTPKPSLTKEKIFSVMDEVNAYYQENSYNQAWLSGVVNPALSADVFGWYALSLDQTCDMILVRKEAMKAADPDVNFNHYSRLIVTAPYGPNCKAAGQGSLDKIVDIPTNDGPVALSVTSGSTESFHLSLVAHELGHNFGNYHANYLDCGTLPITDPSCQWQDYGDFYDVMGSANNSHFNALHKEYTGWFTASNVLLVDKNGRYTIEPIEKEGLGVKALKIRRAEDDFLYAEFRQPIGFDREADFGDAYIDVFRGALLHTCDVQWMSCNGSSLLIDPSPRFTPYQPALPLDKTFTDPLTGTSLSVVSLTPERVTVDVNLGKTDFTPPDVSISSPVNNSKISGIAALTAVAADESGITKVEFYSGDFAPFAVDTLEPYQANVDTRYMPNQSIFVYAIAHDGSGISMGVEGNNSRSDLMVYTVENTDAIYPTVELVSPSANAHFSPNELISIQVNASDNIGVDRVYVYIDGGLRNPMPGQTGPNYVLRSPPYAVTISNLAPASHNIFAQAYDFVGNKSETAKINFTVLGKFRRGDVTGDGEHDISDPVRILDYLFLGQLPKPTCLDAADVNDNGEVELADAQYLLEWMFLGTLPDPPIPFGLCGEDPTTDTLGCESFIRCQ